MIISNADIRRLLQDPSPRIRADLGSKIGMVFAQGEFNTEESALAIDIFRLLLKDAEASVRKSLSQYVCYSIALPHDIALSLARDAADVSVPMLEFSYVLTEEDLIDIVRDTEELEKLLAIARRTSISSALADTLLGTGQEEVITSVIANQGASIQEESMQDILTAFETHPGILEAMVYRGGLSLRFAERLFSLVGDELKNYLNKYYNLSHSVADSVVDGAREWATLELSGKQQALNDVEKLVEHLHHAGKLTHSIVIRSLCMGDMRFFEASMARLASIPTNNARMLLLDPGPLGFKALYEKADLPDGFYDAFKALHDTALEETGYGRFYREDYRRRVIQRIVKRGFDHKIENMPYLMSLIGGKQRDVATVH